MSDSHRILIVDDEPQIRRFLRASLQAHDYVVIEADTGKEGVRQATLHSSTEERAFAITEVKGLDPKAIIREPSLTAMVLETKRFLALRKELMAEGYRVGEWRETTNKERVGIFEMGVQDPAGHLIVLFQYVDAKTPRE